MFVVPAFTGSNISSLLFPPHSLNMAATESVNSGLRSDVESIVNRWLVDYYLFLATELFKNEEYTDFCEIRDVLQSK